MSQTIQHLYDFWVGEQGVPGSLLGDFLVFASTFLVGKYKVAPWLHKRHCEHLDQKERQHRELIEVHSTLIRQHADQHQELLQAIQGTPAAPSLSGAPPGT